MWKQARLIALDAAMTPMIEAMIVGVDCACMHLRALIPSFPLTASHTFVLYQAGQVCTVRSRLYPSLCSRD